MSSDCEKTIATNSGKGSLKNKRLDIISRAERARSISDVSTQPDPDVLSVSCAGTELRPHFSAMKQRGISAEPTGESLARTLPAAILSPRIPRQGRRGYMSRAPTIDTGSISWEDLEVSGCLLSALRALHPCALSPPPPIHTPSLDLFFRPPISLSFSLPLILRPSLSIYPFAPLLFSPLQTPSTHSPTPPSHLCPFLLSQFTPIRITPWSISTKYWTSLEV